MQDFSVWLHFSNKIYHHSNMCLLTYYKYFLIYPTTYKYFSNPNLENYKSFPN
nr:MAG TPA: hypothetical protein [Caudoviricetes sp.]